MCVCLPICIFSVFFLSQSVLFHSVCLFLLPCLFSCLSVFPSLILKHSVPLVSWQKKLPSAKKLEIKTSTNAEHLISETVLKYHSFLFMLLKIKVSTNYPCQTNLANTLDVKHVQYISVRVMIITRVIYYITLLYFIRERYGRSKTGYVIYRWD